jgi:hypothetical protein
MAKTHTRTHNLAHTTQANPDQVRSKELGELQATASSMNLDIQLAKATSLQYQAVLEECKAVLNEWRHMVRKALGVRALVAIICVRVAIICVTINHLHRRRQLRNMFRRLLR